MSQSFDILVIGGGISGVSLAARLAPHATVGLIEAEAHLGTQTTGRSASLLVESYGAPEIRKLSTRSREFFERPPAGFSDAPLCSPRGVLIYGMESDLPHLREEYERARRSAEIIWLEGEDVSARCPLLKRGVAAAGFIEPTSLALDVNALLQGFARLARRHGAEFLTGAPVHRIVPQNGGWMVEAGKQVISCGAIANAAGAWADQIAGLAGVRQPGLQPKRRTAATIGVPAELAAILPTHPFAAPVDDSFYFKPETGQIMVSLSDETPSEPCDAYPDDLDVALALERFHEATIVPRARPIATWAGLRTFAPDRLPLFGFDGEVKSFFWYAGQGGTGIQTSPAASVLAAKLFLGETLDELETETAGNFRAARFSNSRQGT